jgi:hypothetical protein
MVERLTILLCIQLPGINLGQETISPEVFRDLPQYLQAVAGTVT